jgi:uncharacterized repeat protein (TIGR01451 family)
MFTAGKRRPRARAVVGAVLLTVAASLSGAAPALAQSAHLWRLDPVTIAPQEGVEFSGAVACITLLEGQFGGAGDWSATIDWGDGTQTAGTVAGSDFGEQCAPDFRVDGTHTYAQPGTYTMVVRVDDNVTGGFQSFTRTVTVGMVPNDLNVGVGAAPNPVKSGGKLTYTIKVGNGGSSQANNAWLTNTLPSGVQFLSLSASPGTCFAPAVGTTGTIACQLGTLAGLGGATVTVTVKVVARGASTLSDTATVGADDPDPISANNTATVTTSVFGRK